jgi:hypothetical protein
MTHFTEANLTKRKVVRANIVRIANADTTPPIFFFLGDSSRAASAPRERSHTTHESSCQRHKAVIHSR